MGEMPAGPNAFVDTAETDGVMTATTFGLNIFFPIGSVFRSVAFGLNAMEISYWNSAIIPASPICAYGGPVLFLIVQVAALFGIPVWSESSLIADPEKLPGFPSDEVRTEKVQIEITADTLGALHLTKPLGQNVTDKDISIGIGKGELLAPIGSSGAGKLTSIDLIREELTEDYGNGYLYEEDAMSVSAQRHLGSCAKYDALDLLNTKEYLIFFAKIEGVENVQWNVDIIMAKLGLSPFANRPSPKLSGGNKQTLSLAIALMVLVLDEPTSAMGAVAKQAFLKITRQISPDRSLLLIPPLCRDEFLPSATHETASEIQKSLLHLKTSQNSTVVHSRREDFRQFLGA
ncbi:P-loop containing nucleoside triphosphate hydrolase protein [Colletotrichum navitas]|uniref:P-loop containing nucleoside triphosphate hydrolase protein n=1 Tax=Colletotrichum navitas TaxID=681940 RepID=A0AAD8QD09_9PEZI|nr:P-loop containing nucleoside triphosphate hydrolase protein [Colletotrichum navitas]KAK1599949.1 P-loop containing nucleoside triphosphate hydrolase protein [Colletotrichum navitas]